MSVPRETVEQRKAMPLATGLLDYFPDALLVVAEVSRIGNEQHHPGEPLHWDKSKSTDEADALMRHLLDRGKLDTDGTRHSAKVAWRALALLQRELDAEAAEANSLRMCGTRHPVRLGCCYHRPGDDCHTQPTLPTGKPLIDAYLSRLDRELAAVSGLQDLLTAPGTAQDGPKPLKVGIDATSEVWGEGDGPVLSVAGGPSRFYERDVRFNGMLLCCGASEHTLDCPRFRA